MLNRSKCTLFLAMPVLGWALASASASAQCFTPLVDRAKRDPGEFRELANKGDAPSKLPPTAKGVVSYQLPAAGTGGVNIDFYWVDFARPAGVTGKQLFTEIRQDFAVFAKAKDEKYSFGPYAETDNPADVVEKANAKLWASNEPLGALMSFGLGSAIPGAAVKAGKPRLTQINGDVQVICSSELDFLFVTANSENAGPHPVAGFRGFGLIADPNSRTWTFYSKAFDRKMQPSRSFKSWATQNFILCQGHKFWIQFFAEFRGYAEKRGSKVIDWSLKNHGPVNYPIGTGTGPWTELDCGTQTTPFQAP